MKSIVSVYKVILFLLIQIIPLIVISLSMTAFAKIPNTIPYQILLRHLRIQRPHKRNRKVERLTLLLRLSTFTD